MAGNEKGKQVAGKAPASHPSTSSGKRKRPSVGGESARDRRKRNRAGVLRFFDDAARDDDYSEEEEQEEDDEDLDFDDEDAGLDFNNGGKSEGKELKSAGKTQYLPFLVKEEELSGDELEELVKQRYGSGSEYVVYKDDAKESDCGFSLEPCGEDPNIWRVRCMVGREQQLVVCLMHKYADLQRLGKKMDIVSAFMFEHVKGYVYIEADKACDVVEACKGFFNIYPTTLGLVPRAEIPHLLSIRNKPHAIAVGTWVRMKSGRYKGDLGQVVDYDDARKKATVKLVPRIDLQAIAKKYGGGVSLKDAAVPSPRLVSPSELEQFRPHIHIKRDHRTGEKFEVLDGLALKDGYLFKKVSIASIVYWGVRPSEDELLKFTKVNNAEEEDVSWLSSVYNVRKKIKPSETSELKEAPEEGNGFSVHDLVLYGRKAFGVIIDMGKDGVKILKGDVEGQQVMSLRIQYIKGRCVDKMFTALDRHRKTIYINDAVKVLDGPLEGRQGIVRHMYKGTLFLYDENQEENSGILCAKSDLCENISPPKDPSSSKACNKSTSSFNQNPVRCSELEGSTFGMSSRNKSTQLFSLGQTLRIRKGPLKGYLCRVVRIYRSDVTVKLDSLVKVVTVDEQCLSIPNLKRNVEADMPSDVLGNQETLIGGLSGSGGEPTMGTSSWNGASTSWQALSTSNFPFTANHGLKTELGQGADPWGSKVSVASIENEAADPWDSAKPFVPAELGQGVDSWDRKVSSAAGATEQGGDSWGCKNPVAATETGQAANPWGSKVSLAARDNEQGGDSWGNKSTIAAAEVGEHADPWGGKVSAAARENKVADAWGSMKPVVPEELGQGADLWDRNVSRAIKDDKQGADIWGKELVSATADGGADPWGNKLMSGAREEGKGAVPGSSNAAGTDTDKRTAPWCDKPAMSDFNHSGEAFDSWEKASGDQNNAWNKAASNAGCDKDGNGWRKPAETTGRANDEVQGAKTLGNKVSVGELDKGQRENPWASEVSLVPEDHGGANPWARKLSSGAQEREQDADPWAASAGGASRDDKPNVNSWNSNMTLGDYSCSDKGQVSSVKATNTQQEQNSSWKKAATTDKENDGDGWNIHFGKKTSVGCGSFSGEKGTSSWGIAAVPVKPSNEHEDQSNSWDKVKLGTDCQSGWDTAGWDKAGSSTKNGTDGWKNSESSSGDQVSNWRTVGKEGTGQFSQGNCWMKDGDFAGGCGFDSGRGRGQSSWDRSMHRDDDQGCGWGGGSIWNDAVGSSQGQETNWGRQRDMDGCRQFNRGRGRGRYGGRGTSNDDNQETDGNYTGARGSGRERERGRYGGRSSWDDHSRDNPGSYGGGSGSGRGGGRGGYGGRPNWEEDNQDNSGSCGGGWGSGRGRGRARGQFGGEGISGGNNKNTPGGSDAGWGSRRGKGSGWKGKEQSADPWFNKGASGGSNLENNAFDCWTSGSSKREQNSTWHKAASGGHQNDGDGSDKPSSKATSLRTSTQDYRTDPWGGKVSATARDHEQAAKGWGGKASFVTKDQEGADPWVSKLASGAREKVQDADSWSSNLVGMSRDKSEDADASNKVWGDRHPSGRATDGWRKPSGAGEEETTSGKTAPGEVWEKGDGWNKSSASCQGNAGNDAAWGNAAGDAKSTAEHGGELSSWGKPKVPSDGRSGQDAECWGKGGSSSEDGSRGWNNQKTIGNQVASDWKNMDSENAGKPSQRDGWNKPRNSDDGFGSAGSSWGRGGSSWDKTVGS